MANNPYVNKVIYGNDTIIDLTGDTVTPADVASGKTFHDASGTAQEGSYVAPTITDITPSNSDPVLLTTGSIYKATVGGKAVASVSNLNPHNSDPDRIIAGNIYKGASNGYAVNTQPINILPDNNAPVRLIAGQLYDPVAIDGYAIRSYSSKTPDDTNPPQVSSGDIVKMGGAGYLYATQPSSGVGPKYTKSGTLSNFTAANQEQSVDTGLSNITYFYVEGVTKNYSNIRHRAWLDLTITDGAKQVAVQTSTTAATASAISSGTDANGLITGNNNYLKVSGISGGTVTIKGSNSAYYVEQNVKWYAG